MVQPNLPPCPSPAPWCLLPAEGQDLALCAQLAALWLVLSLPPLLLAVCLPSHVPLGDGCTSSAFHYPCARSLVSV